MSLRFGSLLAISFVLQFLHFPYVFSRGGYGAFLYVYFITAIIIGGCLFMGELILGKSVGRSLLESLELWLHDKFVLDPYLTKRQGLLRRLKKYFFYLFICLHFLCVVYFSTVSVWLLQAIGSQFYKLNFNSAQQSCFALFGSGFLFFLFKKLSFFIKIEKLLLSIGLILFAYLFLNAISKIKSDLTLLSYFYPDFTNISWTSLQIAMGHTCLSLFLGSGLVVQFGGTLKRSRDVTSLSAKFVSLSFLSSVSVMFIVISCISDTTFSFFGYRYIVETLPKILNTLFEFSFLATAFLVILYLFLSVLIVHLCRAVQDSSDNVHSIKRISHSFRFGAYFFATHAVVFLAAYFKHFRPIAGASFFDIMDEVLLTLTLPLFALVLSLVIYFLAPQKLFEKEFTALEIDQEISHFFPVWRFIILVVPGFLLVALFMYIFNYMR